MSEDDNRQEHQTVTITFKELNALQSQIQDLRSSNYDMEQREKRLTNEFEKLSTLYNNQEKELQRAHQAVQRSKDRRELLSAMEESERLQNTIEMMNSEHREQSQVLRQNLQMMYERTQGLEKDLEEKKKNEEYLQQKVTQLEESAERNEAAAERQAEMVHTLEERLQDGDSVDQDAADYLGEDDVYHIPAHVWRHLHPSPPLTCTATVQTEHQDISERPSNHAEGSPDGNRGDQHSEEEWNALQSQVEGLRSAAQEWDQEREHAQQQVDMWREKLRIRQERADERQEELQQRIESLEQEVDRTRSDRQDLAAQLAQQESTVATLQQQIQDRDQRITELEPWAEDGRRLADTGAERDRLQERLNTAEREREEAAGRAQALETAAMSGAEQAEEAQRERDEAQRQMEAVGQERRKLEIRTRELEQEMKRIQASMQHQGCLLEQTQQAMLHEWTAACVARGGLTAAEQQAQQWHRVAQHRQNAEGRARAAEEERQRLTDQIRELRVDQRLSRKKADTMVRELRSQLKRERRDRERAEASLSSGGSGSFPPSPAVSPRPGSHGAGTTTTGTTASTGTRRGQKVSSMSSESMSTPRRNSVSSEASDGSMISDANSTSPETLLHENNILVHRVTEMQTARWRLEQRNRVLEDTIKGLHAEIERKTEVIRHFVKRQQVGRLGADMDADREERARWSGSSIMGSIFSGRKVSKTVSADMQAQMQKVLEETIVHNMELQKQIRILGDEVQRLLAQNKSHALYDSYEGNTLTGDKDDAGREEDDDDR
eukprot:gb/GECH01007991.1/.p1 GENE.gb/GECH01007991.1/~~gb/GECH01007991.1/.p1  ORF type:complete len:778 (+),score=240.35 gb/GECH01007991.1/:1-2334(+)